MYKRLNATSKLLLMFLLGSAFILLPFEEGKYKIYIALQDGESILSSSIFEKIGDNEVSKNPPIIKYQNVVLRSFDTDSNSSEDLYVYTNHLLAENYVDYWNIKPTHVDFPEFAFPNREMNSFNTYYHTLFQNQVVRKILFSSALEYVINLIKNNPSDFKERVIEELQKLLKFSSTLKFMDQKVEVSFENDYWEGFIYRRHFSDKISILEIQNYIFDAINKIKAIESQNKIDAMYEVNINNQIKIFYSGKSSYLKSMSSQKKVYFYDGEEIKSIRYLRDITGDYYQINFEIESSEKRFLFNKNLEKVN